MFLFDLAPQEKNALYNLAEEMIAADGQILESETRMLRHMLVDMELDKAETIPLTFEQAIAAFETNDARETATIELLGLAFADGEYAESERALLERISEAFRLSPDTVKKLEDWVERVMMNKGNDLSGSLGYFFESYAALRRH